jgi:N-acetylglutamate synthase-like GNAT family acetyltransferase
MGKRAADLPQGSLVEMTNVVVKPTMRQSDHSSVLWYRVHSTGLAIVYHLKELNLLLPWRQQMFSSKSLWTGHHVRLG